MHETQIDAAETNVGGKAGGRDPAWREHHVGGLLGTLGPLLSRREGDTWVYAIELDERHLNQAGIVHGGTLSALMDHALSTIAWQHCDRNACVTVQLNMNFLAATRAGTLLIARGKVTQSSGSLIFMDGALHTDDGCVSTAQAVMKRLTGRTTG